MISIEVFGGNPFSSIIILHKHVPDAAQPVYQEEKTQQELEDSKSYLERSIDLHVRDDSAQPEQSDHLQDTKELHRQSIASISWFLNCYEVIKWNWCQNIDREPYRVDVVLSNSFVVWYFDIRFGIDESSSEVKNDVQDEEHVNQLFQASDPTRELQLNVESNIQWDHHTVVQGQHNNEQIPIHPHFVIDADHQIWVCNSMAFFPLHEQIIILALIFCILLFCFIAKFNLKIEDLIIITLAWTRRMAVLDDIVLWRLRFVSFASIIIQVVDL